MTRSGGRSVTDLQRRVAALHDLRLGSPAALERVLDETGDVLFVFDDEHTRFRHDCTSHDGESAHLGPVLVITKASAGPGVPADDDL